MLDAMGGRKFIYAIVAIILGFVLVLVDKVTAEAWLQAVEIIGATYIIGNVGKAFASKGESK